jgi:hypothetical protein
MGPHRAHRAARLPRDAGRVVKATTAEIRLADLIHARASSIPSGSGPRFSPLPLASSDASGNEASRPQGNRILLASASERSDSRGLARTHSKPGAG